MKEKAIQHRLTRLMSALLDRLDHKINSTEWLKLLLLRLAIITESSKSDCSNSLIHWDKGLYEPLPNVVRCSGV